VRHCSPVIGVAVFVRGRQLFCGDLEHDAFDLVEEIAARFDARAGRVRMDRVSRAVEKGEAAQGLMRIVVDADTDTDRLLGAAVLGRCGGEAVHMALATMAAHAAANDLRRVTGIHPTVPELIPPIAEELRRH
jgi:pyruvate/2-oxoglutarate dehydrogenase complex dihydrolipoamide dehydrogenase (E3) component